MASVTIGRLHHNIIRIMEISRILDQRLMEISDITGKNNLFFFSVFLNRQLNAGRPQKMPRIYKSYGNSRCRGDYFFIRAWYKILYNAHGIFHCISRHKFRFTLPASLTVTPFRLKHLNVSTVSKHNIT